MEQRSNEWFTARLGKVTASRIADCVMKPTTAGYQNYKAQLVCERLTGNPTETFQSAAMLHGTETEPQARAMYELETGLDVEEVGFINSPTIDWSGASPDGLVGKDGLIEIKCPQPATHIKTLDGAKIDPRYLLQMHWQIHCTGRDWCDFVSFNPAFPIELQLHIQRINADPELTNEITESVETFLADVAGTVDRLTNRKDAA